MVEVPIDLDSLLAELTDLSRRLEALPESARSQRAALLERRKQLRALAARCRPQTTLDMLRGELDALERRRREIFDLHLSVGHVGHAHAGGLDPRSTREFNREVDETRDRAVIERRICEIKARLAELDDTAGRRPPGETVP